MKLMYAKIDGIMKPKLVFLEENLKSLLRKEGNEEIPTSSNSAEIIKTITSASNAVRMIQRTVIH